MISAVRKAIPHQLKSKCTVSLTFLDSLETVALPSDGDEVSIAIIAAKDSRPTHWTVAILKRESAVYIDSLGEPPPPVICQLLSSVSQNWTVVSSRQQTLANTCGPISVFLVAQLLKSAIPFHEALPILTSGCCERLALAYRCQKNEF